MQTLFLFQVTGKDQGPAPASLFRKVFSVKIRSKDSFPFDPSDDHMVSYPGASIFASFYMGRAY